MGRLDGKAAVITGAGSGIGRATAVLFAREGAKVLAADRDTDGVKETAAQIAQIGGTAEARTVDVSDEAQVQAMMQHCVTQFGSLDVAYNNAGIGGGLTHFIEMTADEWNLILGINLNGVFFGIKHAARIMKDAGTAGSIISTASVAGIRSGAGGSAYSASKAGVISLTQTCANQLAGTGIRVNCICPGLTQTGITQPLFDLAEARGTSDRIGQLNPLKRAAQPEEMATVALFLASSDSSYVNGQAIAADGGLSSSHPVVPGKLA